MPNAQLLRQRELQVARARTASLETVLANVSIWLVALQNKQSNSLHDKDNDRNDNYRSNDPVSEHFSSPCISLA